MEAHAGRRSPRRSAEEGAGLSPLLARLLARRGVDTADAAPRLASSRPFARLPIPLLLRGAAEAAERLLWAARSGRRIVVFGDYDVDGVTAAAQLLAALRRAGADARAFIPHRLRDGYGLRPETVRAVLRDLSPAMLVTVDCGITAADGVAVATGGRRRGHRDGSPPRAGSASARRRRRQPEAARLRLSGEGARRLRDRVPAGRSLRGARRGSARPRRPSCAPPAWERSPTWCRCAERTGSSRPAGSRRSRLPGRRACARCSPSAGSPRDRPRARRRWRSGSRRG